MDLWNKSAIWLHEVPCRLRHLTTWNGWDFWWNVDQNIILAPQRLGGRAKRWYWLHQVYIIFTSFFLRFPIWFLKIGPLIYEAHSMIVWRKTPSWIGHGTPPCMIFRLRTVQHGFNDLISQHWMLILEEVLHLISCPAPCGFGPQLKGASCTSKWRQARDQLGMPRSGWSGVANGEYMWRVHRNAKGVWNYSSTLGWSSWTISYAAKCDPDENI